MERPQPAKVRVGLPRKPGMRDRARRGKRWKPVRKMGSAVWVMIDRSEPGRLNSGERECVRECVYVRECALYTGAGRG